MTTIRERARNFQATHPVTHQILNQIGLTLGPASLITLLCQFAGVGVRDTAVICLASVVLLSIFLNYKRLDRRLSSSVVLVGFVFFLTLYYFTYENILLKDTGLQRYYKLSNDYLGDALSQHIKEARGEIWFFGTNFHISAEDKRALLLEKLDKGVHIRYLVFDPFSKHLQRLADDFDSDPENAQNESILGLRDIAFMMGKWNKLKKDSRNPGMLEVRLYETTPRMRAYIFDPTSPGGKVYIVPYINKVNSPESPGFLFKTLDSSVADVYVRGVRKLWDESRPLTDSEISKLIQ